MYATDTAKRGKPCRGCKDPLELEQHVTQDGLAAYLWDETGASRGLGGLGSVFDFPTVTGVVQLAMGQVRLSASGVNFRMLGEPDILAGLESAEGYCVVIEGRRENYGMWVTGWTLLTDDSAGGEGSRYTNCADIIAISPPPNTDNPASGGGTQPPPGEGQIPAVGGGDGTEPSSGNGGNGAPTNGGGGGMPEPLAAGMGMEITTGVAVAVATGLILASIRGRGGK
jgi:hypothetical protein